MLRIEPEQDHGAVVMGCGVDPKATSKQHARIQLHSCAFPYRLER